MTDRERVQALIAVADEVLEHLDNAAEPNYPPNVALRAHVVALRDESAASLGDSASRA